MPEQKTRLPDRRKAGNSSGSNFGLIVIFALFIGIYFIFKRPSSNPVPPPAAPSTQTETKTQADTAQNAPSDRRKKAAAPSNRAQPKSTPRRDVARPEGGTWDIKSLGDLFHERNEKVILEFSSLAQLEIPHIHGMQYITLDLADDIAAVNAYDPLAKINLTILARKGRVTPEEIAAYLRETDTGIPALQGVSGLNIGPPQSLPAPKGSGLKDALVWTATSGDKTINVALMERADGRGSYLAVINSPGNLIDQAEEHYSQFYDKLRVSP